jgi:hypothetical protein
MTGRVGLTSACVVVMAIAAAAPACSTTERAFGGDGDGGGATTTATTATATSTSTSGGPSSSSASSGSQGTGGEAEGGGGSGPTSVGGGGGGGGQPDECGDGDLDPGEECDDGTPLCDERCQVSCPSGWPEADGSCFGMAVGEGGLTPIDALTAAARCGELDVAATGHRAFPATPRTESQWRTVAGGCPNNGCWLGYLNLEPLGAVSFVSPTTGDVAPGDAPWIDGGMNEESVTAVCTKLRDADAGAQPGQVEPELEAQPCVGVSAYFACELRPGVALISACGNGVEGAGEECDGGADCSGCDRRCPAGWREDPSSHACTILLPDAVAYSAANDACLATGVEGARLATPADPSDVRTMQFTASGASGWIGLQVGVDGLPAWVSGEAFDYTAATWPMASSLGVAGDVGFIFDGTITIAAPGAELRRPLCEAHAND